MPTQIQNSTAVTPFLRLYLLNHLSLKTTIPTIKQQTSETRLPSGEQEISPTDYFKSLLMLQAVRPQMEIGTEELTLKDPKITEGRELSLPLDLITGIYEESTNRGKLEELAEIIAWKPIEYSIAFSRNPQTGEEEVSSIAKGGRYSTPMPSLKGDETVSLHNHPHNCSPDDLYHKYFSLVNGIEMGVNKAHPSLRLGEEKIYPTGDLVGLVDPELIHLEKYVIASRDPYTGLPVLFSLKRNNSTWHNEIQPDSTQLERVGVSIRMLKRLEKLEKTLSIDLEFLKESLAPYLTFEIIQKHKISPDKEPDKFQEKFMELQKGIFTRQIEISPEYEELLALAIYHRAMEMLLGELAEENNWTIENTLIRPSN